MPLRRGGEIDFKQPADQVHQCYGFTLVGARSDYFPSSSGHDNNISVGEKGDRIAPLRMMRIPQGADLILNKVSKAPGFWISNVIVMAGVPSIMQAMLDEVAPKLKIGLRILSETVRAAAREGDIGMQLGEIAKANPGVAIGGYPFFDPQHGPNTNVVLRAREAHKLAQAKHAVEDMLERVRRTQLNRA